MYRAPALQLLSAAADDRSRERCCIPPAGPLPQPRAPLRHRAGAAHRERRAAVVRLRLCNALASSAELDKQKSGDGGGWQPTPPARLPPAPLASSCPAPHAQARSAFHMWWVEQRPARGRVERGLVLDGRMLGGRCKCPLSGCPSLICSLAAISPPTQASHQGLASGCAAMVRCRASCAALLVLLASTAHAYDFLQLSRCGGAGWGWRARRVPRTRKLGRLQVPIANEGALPSKIQLAQRPAVVTASARRRRRRRHYRSATPGRLTCATTLPRSCSGWNPSECWHAAAADKPCTQAPW